MEPFIGEIMMVGFNFAPRGWALCNGQILSISQNSALFSLLGTTYGGNGINTFALPNLQGRLPMHWGDGAGLSPHSIGEMAGQETVTLLQPEIPAHSHQVTLPPGGASSNPGNSPSPIGNYPAVVVDSNGATVNAYSSTADGSLGSSHTPFTSGIAGNNSPHNNMQPYLCVTFIIALQGVFPSRS
jgi:microcystin-dependent protein